jgi:lysophospholipase L1-like esterase
MKLPCSTFLFCLISFLTLGCALQAQESDTRLHSDGKGWRLDQAKVTDPKLPRVLLIGDSILNGYLKGVSKSLENKAYIDAWVNPYSQASNKLDEMISEVLAHRPYEVIHFNMGLHGWQKGRIPDGQFEPLTKKLVEALQKGSPKAKLIWASSTPVTTKGKPGELDAEINPIIVEHNTMAARVMTEMKVPVNDLYALMQPHLDWARGDQFHWNGAGSALQAEAVTKAVLREFEKLVKP